MRNFVFQVEITTATFYEMVYEGDRKQLLNMISNFQLKERKVSFCCRMQRNVSDSGCAYALINFLGYLSKYLRISNIESYHFLSVFSSSQHESDARVNLKKHTLATRLF